MRTIYQPCVSGEDCWGHRATRFSRKVYTSRRAAKTGIPDFLECLERQHEHDMGYLGTVDADDVEIIKLELVEEPHERVRVNLPGCPSSGFGRIERRSAMEMLKTVWDEDPERCYSLYCVAGETIRIRGVFGRRLIAEVFSPALLRWELLTMPTTKIPEHTKQHIDQLTATVLDEVKLILGDDA